VADGRGPKLDNEGRDGELAKRRTEWKAPKPPMESGYQKLYVDHVLQADKGADLDFLVGNRGAGIPKESH